VAVGDDAGQITLFDARRYAVARCSGQPGHGAARLAGCLLAGGWDERLTWFGDDPAALEVRGQADLGGPVSAIAALPDLALVATLAGEVHALDRTGAQAWRVDAGAPVTGLGTLDSPGGSLILVGVQDGRLLALDASAGSVQLRWELALGTGGPVWVAAEVAADPGPEVVYGTGGAGPPSACRPGNLLRHVAVPSLPERSQR
jgi:outer membrane protein assembly factor BamB